MKKILPLIFVALLMIITYTSNAAAYDSAYYPNGDYTRFIGTLGV